MTVKKTTGAYIDCEQVMRIALEREGISIPFDSRADAVQFRQRCYKLRKLLYESAKPAPGALAATPFDTLIIRLPNKGEPNDCTLTFEDRKDHGLSILSRIRAADGSPVDYEPSVQVEDALAGLRGKLGLE